MNNDFDEDDFETFNNGRLTDALFPNNYRGVKTAAIILFALSFIVFMIMGVFLVKAEEASKAMHAISCPSFPNDGWFECGKEISSYDSAKTGYIVGAIFSGITGAMLLTISVVIRKHPIPIKRTPVFNEKITKTSAKKNQENKIEHNVCPYCGTKNPKTAHRCKGCGGSL